MKFRADCIVSTVLHSASVWLENSLSPWDGTHVKWKGKTDMAGEEQYEEAARESQGLLDGLGKVPEEVWKIVLTSNRLRVADECALLMFLADYCDPADR